MCAVNCAPIEHPSVSVYSGEYHIGLFLNNVLMSRCPLIGHVNTMTSSVNQMSTSSSPQYTVNPETVILTGHGLQTANLNQLAEFVIDATEAAPG